MKTTIEVFTLEFRRKGKKSTINFADEKYPDIYDLLKDNFVLHIQKEGGDIAHEKKLIRLKYSNEKETYFKFSDKNRIIHGILESGIYGKEFDIATTEDPTGSVYKAKKNTAPMKPFFFFLKIPNKGNKALVILERTEGMGIYSVLDMLLKSFLREYYPKEEDKNENILMDDVPQVNLFSTKRENVITKAFFEEITEAVPKSISLSLNTLPKDVAEKYFMAGFKADDLSVELNVKFRSSADTKLL